MEKKTVFPTETSIIARLHAKDQKLFKTFRRANTLVRGMYRVGLAQLLGFGRAICLLTMKGRKTGLTRKVPVEYQRYHTGVMTVVAARGANTHWLLNILANPQIHVQAGFRKFQAQAKVITDPAIVFEHLEWYMQHHPSLAKQFFGWDKKNPDHKLWIENDQGEKSPGPGYDGIKSLAKQLRLVQLIPDSVETPSK
ncbi:MAG: nitroreductase family deazaflavin-dependent oxidoreductase [Candidatus Ranarchaeia archaeon]